MFHACALHRFFEQRGIPILCWMDVHWLGSHHFLAEWWGYGCNHSQKVEASLHKVCQNYWQKNQLYKIHEKILSFNQWVKWRGQRLLRLKHPAKKWVKFWLRISLWIETTRQTYTHHWSERIVSSCWIVMQLHFKKENRIHKAFLVNLCHQQLQRNRNSARHVLGRKDENLLLS